ncbi:hypothetical protein HDU91_006785 [Kappamyces sp. JEL0680]|nr:hypothetical protein HDU91_006785 [Kappamyces sp. JEL0680]
MNDTTIQLTSYHQAALSVSLVACLISLPLNLLLIYVVIRKKNLRNIYNYFYVNNSIGDVVLLNTLAIGLHQFYLVYCRKPEISQRTFFILIGLKWLLCLCLSVIPFLGESFSYVLHPSGFYCNFRSYSREPMNVILTWVNIFYLVVQPIILHFLYIGIIASIKKIKESFGKTHLSNRTKAERSLLNRAILMSASFLIGRIFIGIAFLYEFIMMAPAPWQLDLFAAFWNRLNTLWNPILCIYLSQNFLEAICEVLGLSRYYTASKRASSTPVGGISAIETNPALDAGPTAESVADPKDPRQASSRGHSSTTSF